METRARYITVGAFVLVTMLAGFGFVYWAANAGGFGPRAVYAIRFGEPVPGLAVGANVLFNGVRVGTVSGVALDSHNPRRVTATVSVEPATPVRKDTVAEASFQGLTGTASISLKGGSPQAPPLTGENGHPPLLLAAPGAGASLTDSARATLHRLDAVLDEDAKPLNTAVNGISAFADMLGRNATRVEDLLGRLGTFVGGGRKEIPTYDLTAAADFPEIKAAAMPRIIVGDVNAALVFDSQKIVSRSAAGVYSAVPDAQWADNLPKLVQAKLVQSFENARQLQSVSRPIEQLTPEYRLDVSIRAFQLGTEKIAQVELAVRLISDKGEVKAAKIFGASSETEGVDPAEAVTALNTAFSQVAAELVRWTAMQV